MKPHCIVPRWLLRYLRNHKTKSASIETVFTGLPLHRVAASFTRCRDIMANPHRASDAATKYAAMRVSTGPPPPRARASTTASGALRGKQPTPLLNEVPGVPPHDVQPEQKPPRTQHV